MSIRAVLAVAPMGAQAVAGTCSPLPRSPTRPVETAPRGRPGAPVSPSASTRAVRPRQTRRAGRRRRRPQARQATAPRRRPDPLPRRRQRRARRPLLTCEPPNGANSSTNARTWGEARYQWMPSTAPRTQPWVRREAPAWLGASQAAVLDLDDVPGGRGRHHASEILSGYSRCRLKLRLGRRPRPENAGIPSPRPACSLRAGAHQ